MQSYHWTLQNVKGVFTKKLGNKRSEISLIKDSSQCRSARSTDYKGGIVVHPQSLRRADATFAVTATIDFLLGPLIITISDTGPCRSIGGRSWNCRGVDAGRPLLLCLLVVIEVVDDDYLTVARRLEDVAVEVTKKLSGELLITRSVNNK
jgi:hypothetical protein